MSPFFGLLAFFRNISVFPDYCILRPHVQSYQGHTCNQYDRLHLESYLNMVLHSFIQFHMILSGFIWFYMSRMIWFIWFHMIYLILSRYPRNSQMSELFRRFCFHDLYSFDLYLFSISCQTMLVWFFWFSWGCILFSCEFILCSYDFTWFSYNFIWFSYGLICFSFECLWL